MAGWRAIAIRPLTLRGMAKLYFRYGAMGSSKTANAIMVQYNYRERGRYLYAMLGIGF